MNRPGRKKKRSSKNVQCSDTKPSACIKQKNVNKRKGQKQTKKQRKLIERTLILESGQLDRKDKLELASIHEKLSEMAENDGGSFVCLIKELQDNTTDKWRIKRLKALKKGILASLKAKRYLEKIGFSITLTSPEMDVDHKVDLIGKHSSKTYFFQITSGSRTAVLLNQEAVRTFVEEEVKQVLQFAKENNLTDEPNTVYQCKRLEKINTRWKKIAKIATKSSAIPVYLIISKDTLSDEIKKALNII